MTGFIKTVERDAWLEQRRSGIGASESPAILGLSEWRSEFQVWAEKVDPSCVEDLSDNEPAEFGIRLEPVIAEAYAARTGRQVAMWPQFHIARHPQHDWLCATPDATQIDEVKGEGLLQIKTTSAYKSSEWKDEPPLMYQVQCQHEMAVTGHDWSTLVVLIGGQRLRYFDIDRRDSFIAALIPRLEKFWRLVESRTPPDVDGSFATAKLLSRLHPDDSGEEITLPSDAAEWTENFYYAKEQIDHFAEVKTEAENKLKAALGAATFGVLPDGSRWSWKTQERAAHEVKASKFRVLRKLK